MSRRSQIRRIATTVMMVTVLISATAQEEFLASTLNIAAVSSDRDAMTADLAEWTEENGGYYTYRSETEIHMRVSPADVSGVRALLETGDAEIVRYDPSTVDLRQQLSDAEAAIAARTEALERVLRYLDGATIGATLAFERELRSLNEEIEQYAGYARRMRNDIRYARVQVVLSSYEQTIPQTTRSSFEWINGLGMYSFLESSRIDGRYR